VLEIIFKPTILDRPHKLVVDHLSLQLGMQDSREEVPLRFDLNEIEAFRYGIKWISGYQFTIGRVYCVDIKSGSGQVMSIRLRSLYGINKNAVSDKYVLIVQALSDYYFNDLCRNLMTKVEAGGEWHHPKIIVTKDGIVLRKLNTLLPWKDIGTRLYSTYYAIYSKLKPEVYESFEFLNDWNSSIVYSLSRSLLETNCIAVE
jgi:hypothetical protein